TYDQRSLTRGRFPRTTSYTIYSAVKVLKPLAEAKALPIEVDIGAEVGDVISDRRRVEQVLVNLLSNAVKFTDSGHVHVQCGVVGDSLTVRVSDTGIGIRSDDIPKLFGMFQQIPEGQPRSEGGTGLGLSICRKLLELLGGQIWAESRWGVGTTFSFTLPLKEGASHETDNTAGRRQ
ncbi:MAG: sensor histidine kinase, partial [Phycisphaerae bacterium]